MVKLFFAGLVSLLLKSDVKLKDDERSLKLSLISVSLFESRVDAVMATDTFPSAFSIELTRFFISLFKGKSKSSLSCSAACWMASTSSVT